MPLVGDKKGQAFAYWIERALANMGVGGLDDPVIFGSAVMKLHGLKDEIGDVDLFVSQRAYDRLRRQGWTELRPSPVDPPFLEGQAIMERRLSETKVMDFHAFYAWTCRDPWLDVPAAMAAAERVCGVMCVPLVMVAQWKLEALLWCIDNNVTIEGSPWEKHIRDLRVLQDADVEIRDWSPSVLARVLTELT